MIITVLENFTVFTKGPCVATSDFGQQLSVLNRKNGCESFKYSLNTALYPLFSPLSQLTNPESVEGLVLINIDTYARGWMDWAAHKVGLSAAYEVPV